MKIFTPVLIVVVLSFIMSACNNNSQEKQRANELELLNAYITKNHPGVVPKKSGLYFISLKEGLGDSIKTGDVVQAFYKTMDITEKTIDESSGYSKGLRYEPLTFTAGNNEVVKGFDEAVTYMSSGSKAKLIIPSELAYGATGSGLTILGFTTLIMEVEIYKVYHAK